MTELQKPTAPSMTFLYECRIHAGRPWCSLGDCWVLLGVVLGAYCCCLGVVMGLSWGCLGCALCVVLGMPWGCLGVALGFVLWLFWGCPEFVMGLSWCCLGDRGCLGVVRFGEVLVWVMYCMQGPDNRSLLLFLRKRCPEARVSRAGARTRLQL